MRNSIMRGWQTLRSGSWAAGLVLSLLLASCTNPFTPAIPEPPSGSQIDEKFGTIDDLFDTMALGLSTKSQNGADAYIHAFAESTTTSQRAFRAFHDQDVKTVWLSGSKGQAATEPWLLDNERKLHSSLSGIRQNSEYLFKFDRDDDHFPKDEEISQDLWAVHRKYLLQAVANSGDAETIAVGSADMLLVKDGTRFFILEWRDRVDPDIGVNPPGDQRCFTWWRLESQ